MEIEGKIMKAMDVRTGTSKRDGSTWVSQDFVLESERSSGYKTRMVFSVFGQDRLQRFAIKEGQYVNVSFRIEAREFEGRWFNTVTAFDVRQREEPEPNEEEKNPFEG